MIQIKEKDNCSGCGACVPACPVRCITMEADAEGFRYPRVDESRCVDCRLCERICPVQNRVELPRQTPDAFAAWHRNEEIRLQSSSGGVFTAIASAILRKGGVVFGAAFDETGTVRHIGIDAVEELWRLRGSKYVQSEIGDVYELAERILNTGRPVLFTGTPCQVAGLLAYLGKPYENLLTQDIICHGVPSPLVFKRYLQEQERKRDSKAVQIGFRDKRQGWTKYGMRILFENGKEYHRIFERDDYAWAFLKNYTLRPSCYACGFKTVSRQADLTLADFWNVEKVDHRLYDDRGVSLVLVHSEKGLKLLKLAGEDLKWQQVDLEAAIAGNSAAVQSAACPSRREAFWQQLQKAPFLRIAVKYRVISCVQRLTRNLKKLVQN